MSDTFKGISCLVASAFGFAVMAFCVRYCDEFGDQLGCFQKGFFRNVIALMLALPAFIADCRAGLISSASSMASREVWVSIVLRSLFGTIGVFANFYALSHIPIGEAMTLNKTAPFFTVLFVALFLGEKVTFWQLLSLVGAFCGAMLVMRPGLHPSGLFSSSLALLGGLSAGAAYACVRKLGRLKVPGSLIVLCFSAISCLAALPPTMVDYHPMTWAQLWTLLGAGAGAAVGQFGVTFAYRFSSPGRIAAFDYTNVIFTALFGWFFLGQIPDSMAIVGFALIVLSAVCMRFRSLQKA